MTQLKSPVMKFFDGIGFERLGWALRRLYCPVTKDALVLDVGSGGNPYPRANVLLDAYEDTFERYHSTLVKDRPLVFGLAEQMPFKDKAFDFVIASHVLEHSSDPEKFLSELMRVGRAGYIETPDAFFERINPFRFHRLEVTDHNGKLFIYKKPSWKPHAEWVGLYERKMKDREFIRFLQRHPAPFYVRYYWQDTINFEIENSEADASWPFPVENSGFDSEGARPSVRRGLVKIVRAIFSQRRRNRQLDITDLLQCPTCNFQQLTIHGQTITCAGCGAVYASKNGVPMLYPSVSGAFR